MGVALLTNPTWDTAVFEEGRLMFNDAFLLTMLLVGPLDLAVAGQIVRPPRSARDCPRRTQAAAVRH